MKKIIGKTGFVENHDEFENDMDGLNSDMDDSNGEDGNEELEETMMEKRKKKAKKDEDEKKEKMKESTSNFYKNEIKKFYVEEAKKVPALEDFEEEILSSKSLVEAVRKVDKIKGKSTSDSPVRLTEKVEFSTKNDWLRASDY
jgi:hypothetical protein